MAQEQESNNDYGNTKDQAKMELVKGKQIATRLKTLLQSPVGDLEPELCDQLAMQIFTSFNKSITLLTSCPESAISTRITAVDAAGHTSSAESTRKVKDRSGCYKRRKSSDSWIKVSKTMEDGLAWRKYGQKEIQNSTHPRCYFRCTNRHQQGCKAIKQVQRLNDNPYPYQTTYFNYHTCIQNTLGAPEEHIVDPDPVDPNILGFNQLGTHLSNPANNIFSTKEEDSLVVKVESKEDIESSLDPWKDILGAGSDSDCWFGYKPLWGTTYEMEVGSGFDSCVSTSFGGLNRS